MFPYGGHPGLSRLPNGKEKHMADFKEEIAKIEELAKEDEQFRNEYFAAVEARDVDACANLLASKGFAAAAEGLRAQMNDGVEVDEAELQAVAGGANRYEKLDEYCGDAGHFMCGLGLGVALWSPSFNDDK